VIKKIAFFIVIACLFTSCWDRSDIENKNIVSLIGYDRAEDDENGNKIKLILATPILSEDEGNSNNSDSMILTDGKTFNDALDNLTRESSKEISLDQVKILLIKKDLLNDSEIISELADSLLRNPFINRKTYMAAVDDAINDLIDEKKSSSENIQNYILGLLKNYTSNSADNIFDINSFLISYYEKKDMLIPILDCDKNHVFIDCFTAFNYSGIKKDISLEDFKICQILKGRNIPILVTLREYKVDISLNNNRRSVYVDDNNMEITLNLTAEIKQKQEDNFNREKIVDNLNKQLEKNINDVLNVCSKYDIDILGLHDYFYKYHQNKFNKLNLSDSIYDKINIHTKTNVRIDSKGESS